jgi:hypothetical protein
MMVHSIIPIQKGNDVNDQHAANNVPTPARCACAMQSCKAVKG